MEKLFRVSGFINYLIVVFLNAFTDLGHKIIIQNTVFKVYDGELQIILTAIVNALVLLPFILMFSPSGFLADRFPKNKIMEYSAAFAVVITLFITYSYYQGWFYVAFAMTFLLSLQSAIYGPAKYGYIKELVGVKFISSGNGAVQATTTVAILGGIIFYTVLFENSLNDSFKTKEDVLLLIAPLGWLLVIGSVIEWFLASRLPNKMIEATKREFKLKRYITGAYLQKNLKTIKRKEEVLEAILALSLFWSISQVVLAIFGEYAKSELGVTNAIFVQGVMALAGIGIVLGSIMASNLSKYYINTGLVALGSLSIMVLVFAIPFISSMKIMAILFTFFGIAAGFLMVPLNAQIQFLSSRVHLGTVLAGSNFIQNIFMFVFLILTTIFAYFGMNAKILFFGMGFVALFLSAMLLKRYFIMTVWSLFELILKGRHKYRYFGLDNIPQTDGVLLLGNHVSWIDWIILQIPLQRRINFLMDKDIYNWEFLHPIFKLGEAIPVSPRAFKDAFKEAHKRLQDGKIVALFPEGEIARKPELGEFNRGYELIPTDYKGVVIPFYIDGVFGSHFTRYKPKNEKMFFRRREINVYFGAPVSKDIKADELKEIVLNLKKKYEEGQMNETK